MNPYESRNDEVVPWRSGVIYGVGELVSYRDKTYLVKRTVMASTRMLPSEVSDYYKPY